MYFYFSDAISCFYSRLVGDWLTVKDKCQAASLGDVLVATLSVEMRERTAKLCFKLVHF